MPNVLINGNVNISLGQSDYKAQGGEGIVYVKNNIAYKIYHEPKKMIPEGKILELQKIKTENVLAPKNILYNPKTLKAIGFTMPYVNDTEYLTKLFSKQFKNDHAISISQIIEIISKMQKQLQSLHNEKIIVGDYNEMNFLIDSSFSKKSCCISVKDNPSLLVSSRFDLISSTNCSIVESVEILKNLF